MTRIYRASMVLLIFFEVTMALSSRFLWVKLLDFAFAGLFIWLLVKEIRLERKIKDAEYKRQGVTSTTPKLSIFKRLFERITLRTHYKKHFENKYNQRLGNMLDYLDDKRVTIITGPDVSGRVIKDTNACMLVVSDGVLLIGNYIDFKLTKPRKPKKAVPII